MKLLFSQAFPSTIKKNSQEKATPPISVFVDLTPPPFPLTGNPLHWAFICIGRRVENLGCTTHAMSRENRRPKRTSARSDKIKQFPQKGKGISEIELINKAPKSKGGARIYSLLQLGKVISFGIAAWIKVHTCDTDENSSLFLLFIFVVSLHAYFPYCFAFASGLTCATCKRS